MKFERGQVYFLRGDNTFGHEMSAGGRPILVVSSENHNDGLPTILAASLSRTPRSWTSVVPVSVNKNVSYVVCNQIKTLDKERFCEREFICKLTDEEMSRVDEALMDVLGLTVEENMCRVEVAEPVNIEDIETTHAVVADDTELRVELAMYKKLYEKALEKLIDLKLEKDTRVEKPVIEVCEPVVKEKVLSEEEVSGMMAQLEEAGLKQPEMKKRGRPPKKKVEVEVEVKVDKKPPYNAKRADIEQYKKKSGKVNVNTDEWFVIAATTGMKATTAQGICSYRNKYGEYESIVDLLDVPSFSSTMLDKYGRMLEV